MRYSILLPALRLSALLIAPGIAFAPAPAVAQDAPHTITVSGEASVSRRPDMATLALGVVTTAPKAMAALNANAARAKAVLAQLTASGLDARDIQTSTLGLAPVWAQDPASGKRRRITGYSVSNRLTIRLRDLGRLGAVLDAVVANGANRFDGLSFGLQKPGPARDEARIAAVHEALCKAALYARAAGVSLGPVLSISEAGGFNAGPTPLLLRAEARVPIARGEVVITARVRVVVALGK